MKRFVSLYLPAGIAIILLVAVFAVWQASTEKMQLPIPQLDLTSYNPANGSLMGSVSYGNLHFWSTSETAVGIVLAGSSGAQLHHNFTQCSSNGPLLSAEVAQDQTTRFWLYEYVGDENTRKTSGYTGREMLRGRFFVSNGERNVGAPADRYNYLLRSELYPTGPTIVQNGIQAGKRYYWMLEQDMHYSCAGGLSFIGGAANSSYSSGNSQSSNASFSSFSSLSSSSSDASSSASAGVCGNGIVEGTEECDDGNANNADSCVVDLGCVRARCGDGYFWTEDGGNEACDDGNTNDGDGCFSTCNLMIPPDA